MEEEKPQQRAAHQIDGAAVTANVVVDVHMQMQEAVAADRERLDDAANDEALAHALHMEDLMEMTESQLRARPSFLPAGWQGHFASSSGAGGRDNLSGNGGQNRFFSISRTGGQDRFSNFPRTRDERYVNLSEVSAAVHQDVFVNFSRAGVFPVEYTFTNTGGGQDPFSSSAEDQDPMFNFHPRRIGDRNAFALSRASTGAQTNFLPRSPPVLPHSIVTSSTSAVATLPSETVTGCVDATALPTPNIPVENVVSSKRRTLLADADAQIILAGMAEGHDNGWYESIISDAADEELEKMEELGLRESLQQCIPRTPNNTTATVADKEEQKLCLQKFCNKWSISLSDLAPDEPGPSTKRAKVPALADDEVPKFDCGICMETLDVFDLFHGMLCKHKFCTACMEAYVEGRIREDNLPIPCPDPACKGEDDGILHPEKCKKAIDFAAFGDWGVRLTERAIPVNRRAYCPNRQCGVMLETSGEQKPAKALCPACRHLLCAACGMEWSNDGSGEHDCAKGPDAALVMKLAAERRWKQCPRCKIIVERIDGCNTMTCRCHCVFCYRCGRPLAPPQAEEIGGQPCRCNSAGLAFALAHQQQVHLQPHFVLADGGGGEGDGVHAFDLNDEGGDPAQQQE